MKRQLIAIWLVLLMFVIVPIGAMSTVTTTNITNTSTGDGSTLTFPFTFAIQKTTDMQVYVAGVLQPSGYSVSINSNGVGGNVVFIIAPVNGAALQFSRLVPLTQTTHLVSDGVLSPSTLENAYDKLTMATQQINGGSGGGSGTVTNVAMTGDGVLFNPVVSGSPINSTGTFQQNLASQLANSVFCNATTGAAAPAWLQCITDGTFLGRQAGVLGFFAPPGGGGGGGGTVTNFTAPSGSWPSWLIPTVTNNTTTPNLAVASATGLTGNQALMTPNGTTGVLAPRSIVIADLPASGVTANTYVSPSSVTVNAQGAVTSITAGTAPVILTNTINISSAQLLASKTTPIVLVNAPGAGKLTRIYGIDWRMTRTSTGYTGGGGQHFCYRTGTVDITALPSGAIVTGSTPGTIDYVFSPVDGTTNTGTLGVQNDDVIFTTSTANFATGTGTAQAIVQYSTN